jgi:hypothetical protein
MAGGNYKNFAYSTVLTAPSPETTGTSLVVQSGDGAKFPAVPFNATVWATNANPTTTNSEIVRVTNISTDTLTIVRYASAPATIGEPNNQSRSIVEGDQIAATITGQTLLAQTEYRFNVCDYGAKGDGSTNDLTAIQACITAAGAAGGRGVDVFFPAGVYAVGGTITCNFNNVMLIGSGWESTVIYCTVTTDDVIQFGDNSTVYSGCGLKSMSVWKSSQGTTGFNINIRKMNDVVITDFVVNNAFSGINIIGVGVVTPPPNPSSVKTWIQRGEINACAATGVGITINNANPAAAGDTYLDNLVFSQGGTTTGTAGINIINTGHCSIMRCNVTNYGTGLLVNPGDTQSVNYLFIDHCLFDSCDTAAEFSSTGATPGVIKSTACVNSWFAGSAVDYGIYINGSTAASADGFVFTACRILNNKQHGVNINKGQNINFSNCVIAGNDSADTTTYSGVEIASGISSVSIFGCRICQSGTAANTQKYAIEIQGGASSELRFLNNDLSPNKTASTTTPYTYINLVAALTGTGNEIGSPIIMNQYRPDAGPVGLALQTTGASATMGQSSIYVQPIYLKQHLNAYKLIMPAFVSTGMIASNSSWSGGWTMSMALYSRGTGANSTRIESLLSRTGDVRYSGSSNSRVSVTNPLVTISNSTAMSTSRYSVNNVTATNYMISTMAGGHMWVFPISSTLTPGEYWLAVGRVTATAGNTSQGMTLSNAMMSCQGFGGGYAHWGQLSSATNAGINFAAGLGTYTVAQTGFPGTIVLSNGIRGDSSTIWQPYFEINGNVTNLSDF